MEAENQLHIKRTMISGTGHKISISIETQYGNHFFESLDSDMIIIKWIEITNDP